MVTREQIIKAEWYKFDYFFHEGDDSVRPFLALPAQVNWLKRAREALFLTKEAVAIRLEIARPTYSRFEKFEQKMSLENLRKCAEAMDCELVYAIRPKQRTLYSERIWRMLDIMKPTTLAGILERQYRPEWRHRHGWVRNGSTVDPHVRQHMKGRKTGDTNSIRGWPVA